MIAVCLPIVNSFFFSLKLTFLFEQKQVFANMALGLFQQYQVLSRSIQQQNMPKKQSGSNSTKLPIIHEVDEPKQIYLKKQWLIQSKKDFVLKKYAFANKLGEGAFGQVYKATLIGTDIIRAIKVIRKDKVAEPSRLMTEINLMKELDHPNLVKLYETYETDMEIYLVMEYCEGGQLFSRVQNGKKMSEKEAREVFRDIAKAITYLHSRNVCHRDLKPENFLFLDKTPTSILKLTDFGLSTTVTSANKLKSMVGTVYYISPQVLESQYDISCDVWSLGVILIVLLTGQPPFQGEEDRQIMNNILKKNIIIPKDVSATAKNLISRCLMPPQKRITALEILEHPWLIDKQKKVIINQKMDITTMRKFSESNQLKKLVLTIIASQVRSKEVEDIAKLFKILDVNSNGQLSREQILSGLKKSSARCNEVDYLRIIQGIDSDKNGKISYTQFLAAMIDEKIYLKPKYLKIAFDVLDKDGNGLIKFNDLKQILMSDERNNRLTESQWISMIKEIDKNNDRALCFEQFLTIFQK